MRKWLVTGGAGFIGSNFIYYILKQYPDDKVICLDSLTFRGNLITLDKAVRYPNFVFEMGDIADENIVNRCIGRHKPDYLINFACETSNSKYRINADKSINTNVLGVQVLLNACRKHGIERFHQVSNVEVYGNLSQCPLVDFNEQSQLVPHTPYYASKAAADLMAISYYKAYKLPVSISRCTKNYGPFQYLENFIPQIIINAMNDKIIPVYDDGNYKHDLLFVEDHCKAIELIVKKGKDCGIYNLKGNNKYKNIEIANIILELLNKPKKLISYIEHKNDSCRCYSIDDNKLRNELRWKPKYNFEKGLKKTINWYLNNRIWCESVLEKVKHEN